MRTRQDAWLNGLALSAANPLILVQNVIENTPKSSQKTVIRPGTNGLFLTENRVDCREIMIEFGIRERLDYAARAAAVGVAAAWGRAGGWLEIAQRPGQQIWVVMTAMPALGKPSEWNKTISMTLTAYAFPYWIERIGNRAQSVGAGTDTELTLSVGGTEPTMLEAVITPTAALHTVSISVDDGSAFELDGLTVAAETPLTITVDPYRLLTVTANGTGLLSKRSDTCFNPLSLTPGQHTVQVETDVNCAVALTAKGVFL